MPAGEYTVYENEAHMVLIRGAKASVMVLGTPGNESQDAKNSLGFLRTGKGGFTLRSIHAFGQPTSMLPVLNGEKVSKRGQTAKDGSSPSPGPCASMCWRASFSLRRASATHSAAGDEPVWVRPCYCEAPVCNAFLWGSLSSLSRRLRRPSGRTTLNPAATEPPLPCGAGW